MKIIVKLGLSASMLMLAACGEKEPEVASAICPAENVLADVSSYSDVVADPTLSQADFFTANGKMKGVKTTPSGLQYRVNKTGPKNGPSPTAEDGVIIHYHGQFMNGETFDSSYDRNEPLDYKLGGLIKGWIEGVGMMKPCDAWTLYIPSDLAYGPNGRGSIPPATQLKFHVQLIEVK